MGFWQGFNFDTVLATISCITGIISLFIGSTAYKKCKINENNLKSKKKFENNGQDNSINVGGDYTVGVSDNSLKIIMKEMSSMNEKSFSTALDNAYSTFQKKCDDNLHKIIDETKKIIEDNKINIAGYTKIDWIHIYFESAKNTSDIYMQKIWAKVLARELSMPNSFTYKTLETLKNMSSEEFIMFDKISSLNIYGAIFKGEYLDEQGFNWMNLQKLKEYGLISLESSVRKMTVKGKDKAFQILNQDYVILFRNETDNEIKFEIPCYLFTNVADELMNIISKYTNENTAIQVAQEVKKCVENKKINVSLHKITTFYENSDEFYYDNEVDLLEKTFDFAEENSLIV